MVFSSIRRSITHSARSKLNRNVISGSYNWRNTLRHDSFPPSLTPLGNACVDGCVGILRGYIAYNGAGKQLLSKAYMSNLKSVLGIPRIRRLFSSQGPGKKTLRKLLSEKQEGNSERGRTEISVQRGIRCRWSGEYSGTVFEADSRFIAPLMFIGFIVTSLFLNPHQTKEISFQEFKNKLLEPGLVNHVEVANKSVAKVYMRSSACEKVHSDDSVRDTVNGSPSEGNVTQFKYYFNIGSVQSFEEKLEGAQEALGIDRPDFVPVIYVSQVMWSKELLRYGPTMLLLGALWFMSRKMPSIGGPGGKSGRGIFNIGKAQVTKLDKNAKNKVLFKDVAGCDEAKQEIMEFVHFLKHPKKYEELGAKIPKGALLVGHPGTGKTLLAKATADESGVPFLSISGSDFMEMFVGVGTSRVQSLFQEARQCAPSIIFIDEIDAIGWARGHGGFSGGHGERESTLNQLLVELDGFGTTAGVVGLAGSVALIGLIFWIKLS